MIADLMIAVHAQIKDCPAGELQQRQAVVQEALCWLGTPYLHQGRVMGAGVDCGMFLMEVFERAGVWPHIEPEPYRPDWFLHQGAERYLDTFSGHTMEIEGTPLPGDIILLRVGRHVAHGAIVEAYPGVIHAHGRAGVVLDDVEQTSWFRDNFASARSAWGVQ